MSNSLRAFILLLLCAGGLAAQESTARQLVVPLAEASGFVSFRLTTTEAAQPGATANLATLQTTLSPQALLGEHNTIHRVLFDAAGNFVFGYDLTVEPLVATHQFKVYVKPLSTEFAQQLRARRKLVSAAQPTLNGATLPRAAEAQTLDDGDAFALDLLINPQTDVRVTDVVKVTFERAPLRELKPRDFTLDSVQLAMQDYRLTLNGTQIGGGRLAHGCTGPLIWFYVPGRGRFIFSLVPRAGYDFQQVGLIEDNLIRFDFHGEHYEWISSAPVIGNGGVWNVWLLHDPHYTPEVSSPEEIARQMHPANSAAQDDDEHWLKDILAGRPPHPQTQPQTGYTPKQAKGAAPERTERVRIGAADRMENLLPKN
jgi:hypothetical protein